MKPGWTRLRRPRISAEAVVEALYGTLLGRSADPVGLAHKVGRLENGDADVAGILTEILGSEEFAEHVPSFIATHAEVTRMRFTNDMSQFGEVWIYLRDMLNIHAASRYVVDLGARGVARSNSYDLMKRFGWSGLLVEANPRLIPELERDFAGLDVRIVSCAVAPWAGRATFTLGVNDDVSSLIGVAAARWGETRGEVEVEVKRLTDILDEAAAPRRFDLLSIDVEGEDLSILSQFVEDGRYEAGHVIVEVAGADRVVTLAGLPVAACVAERYEIVATTPANLILRRRVAPPVSSAA